MKQIKILENEYWWGVNAGRGYKMPFDANTDISFNMGDNPEGSDQYAPFLLSSKGRYVWSEKPFRTTFKDGTLTVETEYDVELVEDCKTLKGAYLDAMKKHFPFNGKTPDKLFFTAPQYNTWMELGTGQTTEGILKYARSIVDNGLTPGVLMIDGGWQEQYGFYFTNARKVPDLKYLTDELHKMGFKVMVWVSPIVGSAGHDYKQIRDKGYLIRNADGEIAIRKWWSGFSAVLDLTNPETVAWVHSEYKKLIEEYGVDGFKLDAGDQGFYRDDDRLYQPMLAREHTYVFNELGAPYPFNEYRAAYKFGGREIVARLHDKHHTWDNPKNPGLNSLIPNTIMQGLLGYAYCCPDMVGGGQIDTKSEVGIAGAIDEELFIRWTQANALMGMMQLSIGPWRILSKESWEIVKKFTMLHKEYGEHFWALAQNAAKTGEPIVRSMEYQFPGNGYETIVDQFVLGDDIIVAPVVKKGQFERDVKLPEGKWLSDEGKEYIGGTTITEKVPLDRLCFYKKIG